MANLAIDANTLEIEMSSFERIGALRPEVRVPLGAITDVRYCDNARREVKGLRIPGTSIPGRLALGTWRSRDRKTFVAAYRDEPGYVIDLEGEKFDRLIVSAKRNDRLDGLAS